VSTPLVVIPILPASLPWMHRARPIGHSAFAASEGNRDVELSDLPAPGASAGPINASDWHILVVDDEPDIRMMLRLLLQDDGYRVSEASDGVVGLAQLRASSRPMVVLLDYKMPRMNGEELLQAVIADPRLANRHAFIFLTANLPALSPALHQLLSAAAIPVVQKPFAISQILHAIEQAIVRLRASPDPPSH